MQALDALPREEIDPAEVEETLQFRHAITTRWGMEISDNNGTDWGAAYDDFGLNLQGGEVQWSYRVPWDVVSPETEAAQVRRTATFPVVGRVPETDITSLLWRPWLDILSPYNRWIRFYSGVFVATMPIVSYDGIALRRELDLADKTHLYARESLPESIQVPYLRNGILEVRESLETVFGETEFDFPASADVVQDDLVFLAGTSYAEYYNAVLQACGYEGLFLDYRGRPTTRKANELSGVTEGEWTYQPGTTMLEEGSLEPLLPEIPNQLVVVAARGPSLAEEGNGIRTVQNLSTGPTSYEARGEKWVSHRITVEASDQANLDAIALDMGMRYFAGGGLTYSGSVALNPLHDDRDVVGVYKPAMGLGQPGDPDLYVVTSWALPFRNIESEADVTMRIEMDRLVVPEFAE